MTYPTMLLCLDDDRPADARTAQAIRLARREGDHLAGLSCRRPSLFRAPVATAAGGSADLLATEMEAARLLATARERRFVSLCEREALASFALDVDDALEPGLALLERAPVHDLLILGQPDPSEPEAARRREVVERVLQHNPRPTLLLPYAGAVEEIGRSVVVAWDGSHGSARAAADALPLLRQARSVQLLYFDGSGGATLTSRHPWASYETIRERTGFAYAIKDDAVTPLADEETRAAIRAIDKHELRHALVG